MTRISEAESRIMDALWRRGPLVVEDIIAEVAPPQQWSDATVKSLIGRMLKKKTIQSLYVLRMHHCATAQTKLMISTQKTAGQRTHARERMRAARMARLAKMSSGPRNLIR